MFLEDAPAVTDFMTDAAGIPASAVPQYWHRAAGFADKLIAHAESKHFVKFMREHGAAQPIWGNVTRPIIKKASFFIIFSLWHIISKNTPLLK